METSLKTGFAQIFSCCPKNLSCPKCGGAPAPLAHTPMKRFLKILKIKKLTDVKNLFIGVWARGAGAPPHFGQQEKIWAKPVFKDVSMFFY